MPVLLWLPGLEFYSLVRFLRRGFLIQIQRELRRGQAPTLLTGLRWKRVRNSGTDVQGSIGRAHGCKLKRGREPGGASGRQCLNTFVNSLIPKSSEDFLWVPGSPLLPCAAWSHELPRWPRCLWSAPLLLWLNLPARPPAARLP